MWTRKGLKDRAKAGPTFGLLNVFYVAPYKMLTDAALYQKLKANA